MMNRVANVALVLGILFGMGAVIVGVLVFINRDSPEPDAGIGLSLMSIGQALVVLGMILKRGHQKAKETVPRQDG